MWRLRGDNGRPNAGAQSVCRVCGWDDGDRFYDDSGSPTYIICDCCGSESGVDEHDVRSARRYRQEWIDSGARWFSLKHMPLDWSIEQQLQRVPAAYR